jgi:Protein of unknown function (DUF3224)
MYASATFDVHDWREEPYEELGGDARLARAHAAQSFHGDIEGDGTAEYLLAYRDGRASNFVGLQYVVGRLAGRAGSFVLELNGTFDGATLEADWFVVPGTATGRLRGLQGEGGFAGPIGKTASVDLDYEFE